MDVVSCAIFGALFGVVCVGVGRWVMGRVMGWRWLHRRTDEGRIILQRE